MVLSDELYEEVGLVFDSIFERKMTTNEEWESRTPEFVTYLESKGLTWDDWTETLEFRIDAKKEKGNV